MGLEPCAFACRKIGVHQESQTRSGETPIARGKTSLQQASCGFANDSLVIALSQRVGLRHTILSFIMQDIKPLQSLLNFTGIVRIKQLNLPCAHEMSYAKRSVVRILGQSGVNVAQSGINIQDGESLFLSGTTNHLFALGVKVVTGNKIPPLLVFPCEGSCFGPLVFHDTTSTRVTIGVLRVMIKQVSKGLGLSFQVTFGVRDIVGNLVIINSIIISNAFINLFFNRAIGSLGSTS